MTQTTTAAPTQSAGKVLAILMIIGGPIVSFLALVCIVTFYATQGQLPIPMLGSWNVLIGFMFWLIGTAALIAGIVWLVVLNRAARRAH